MKLQIDTFNKTFTILSKVDLNELLGFIKEHGMEDWSVEPYENTKDTFKWTEPSYIQKVDPYFPPFTITCTNER